MRKYALLAAAVVALAIPATAAAHPAVYEVERKTLTEVEAASCNYGAAPAGTGSCLDAIPGPARYVVVNHNIPIAYDETNGLDASDGGVINFQRFPGAFRKTIPSPAEWLTVLPPRSGVQPHATCEATATTIAANIVGWQGTEPFYAYIPWQSTAAGLDDDPAEWLAQVKALTGVDLAGMDEAAAKAACEALDGGSGVFHKADTPLATSIASGLVAHEVEHAVAPLQSQVDGLLAEQGTLQGQIDAWRAKGSSLEGQVAALGGEKAELQGQLSRTRKANAKLKKASAKKSKTIKRLRKRLAGHGNG